MLKTVKLERVVPVAPDLRVDELTAYKVACEAAQIPVAKSLKYEVKRQLVLSELQRLEVGVYPIDRVRAYQNQQVREFLLHGRRMEWKAEELKDYAESNVVPVHVLKLAAYLREECNSEFGYPAFTVEYIAPSEPFKKKANRWVERRREAQRERQARWNALLDPFLFVRIDTTRSDSPVDCVSHWDEIDFDIFDKRPQIEAPKPKEIE